jgi:uncharacterized protein YjiS (DUF1127 family)
MPGAAPKGMRFARLMRSGGVVASTFEATGALLAGTWLAIVSLKHRREVARLGRRDDRALADIGILRSDLRAALRAPLWMDPSRILTERVNNRRAAAGASANGLCHKAISTSSGE